MANARNWQIPWLLSVSILTLAGCGGSQGSAPADGTQPVDAGAPAGNARGAELGEEIRGADPEDRETSADTGHGDSDSHGDEASSGDHHGEDDHDHDDEDMAGGEAHVHGHAELAAVLEGRDLIVSLQAPLASFGLPEKAPETDAETATMEQARLKLQDPLQAVTIDAAAGCIFSGSDIAFRYRGDHGSAEIDYNFSCSRPDDLASLTIDLFDAYDGLDEIDAVFLAGADQNAATLTPANSTLSRN